MSILEVLVSTSLKQHFIKSQIAQKMFLPVVSCLKGVVQPKIKICWNSLLDRPNVKEFVSSSDLEKCSIESLSQQWMLCSEWVPSEWESKQLIKTSQ